MKMGIPFVAVGDFRNESTSKMKDAGNEVGNA